LVVRVPQEQQQPFLPPPLALAPQEQLPPPLALAPQERLLVWVLVRPARSRRLRRLALFREPRAPVWALVQQQARFLVLQVLARRSLFSQPLFLEPQGLLVLARRSLFSQPLFLEPQGLLVLARRSLFSQPLFLEPQGLLVLARRSLFSQPLNCPAWCRRQ
jgi:hypothetical protein